MFLCCLQTAGFWVFVILTTPVAVPAGAQQQQQPKELIPEVPILPFLSIAASQGFLLPSLMSLKPLPASPASSPAVCSQELGHTSEALSRVNQKKIKS